MRLQPQIERLYAQLVTELSKYAPTEHFLSQRTIMRRYDVNLRVVTGALNRMVDEGLIESVRGLGFFCRRSRDFNGKMLFYAIPDWPSPEVSELTALLEAEANARTDFRLIKHKYDPESLLFDRWPVRQSDAILLVGDSRPFSANDLKYLLELDKPVVACCKSLTDGPLSTVNFDNIGGGMLAAEYLISHGCQRLMAIQSEPPLSDIVERIDAFCHYAKLRKTPCVKIDCRAESGEKGSVRAEEILKKYLRKYGRNFDAIFVDCYGSAPGVYSALAAEHLRIPEDVSVISFDGFGADSTCHPALTTVGIERSKVAKLLFDQLSLLCSGNIPHFALRLPMELHERESVVRGAMCNVQCAMCNVQ